MRTAPATTEPKIGVVCGKRELLDAMPPWQGGGNPIADVTFERTIFQPPPNKFEAGTGSIADAVGLGAAIIGVDFPEADFTLMDFADEAIFVEDCKLIHGFIPVPGWPSPYSTALVANSRSLIGAWINPKSCSVRSANSAVSRMPQLRQSEVPRPVICAAMGIVGLAIIIFS